MKVVKTLGKGMVPRAGVEPARPFGQWILSPQRLPFRHPGMLSVTEVYQASPLSANNQYREVNTWGLLVTEGEPARGIYILLAGRASV
jgi:hypothetical protein